MSVPPEEADRALVTWVPRTTSGRGTRFEVPIPVSFLRPGVFDAQNIVTIPNAKLMRKLGALSSSDLTKVEAAVRLWLGLS